MASSTEGRHDREGIISLAHDDYNVVNGIVVSGQNLAAMTAVGKVTASGKYKVYDNAAGDGSEAAAGILLSATDASGGDVVAAIMIRGPATINESELTIAGDATAIAAAKVDLAALVPPIIVRAAL